MNRYYSYPNITHWGRATAKGRDFESGCVALARDDMWVGKNYDLDQMIHCATGKDMMDGADLERQFSDIRDPALQIFWDQIGLSYAVHEKSGHFWLSFVPKSALENQKKLPVILVFRPACIFAQSFYFHLNQIAAQGEVILLYFSTEDAIQNDLFVDILADAAEIYPIDLTRVYATGHSHYGEFVSTFSARHPNLLAAVAQQCVTPGINLAFGVEQLTDQLRQTDLPLIILSGFAEMVQVFPVNADAPTEVDPQWKFILSEKRDDRIQAWQTRLYACRCPVSSHEEIMAASNGTMAERMLGFPTSHSETLHVDGLDYYIGDIQNEEGKPHLRVVCIENFPHTTCKFMHDLSWSFLRKFARCSKTKKVIHLFA